MKTIQFRGQQAVVFAGNEMPEKVTGMYYYGIRRHQTENIPLSVEKLVVFNRWGTIVTPEPLHMDMKNGDQSTCDRTELTFNEVMSLMGYTKVAA